MPENRYLHILQHNMRKSYDTAAITLREESALAHDIIAVQEPWSNPFQATSHNPQKQGYNLVWPSNEIPQETGQKPVRVCTYIHKRIHPGTIQITNHSPTLQTIRITFKHAGRSRKIAIHNAYLAPAAAAEEVYTAKETIALIDKALEENAEHEQILLGDFNAWHTDWFGRDVAPTGMAKRLKEITTQRGLSLILEPGIVTRPPNIDAPDDREGSTIDLVWGTQQVAEQVTHCDIAPGLQNGSDHYPIHTSIAFQPDLAENREEWKYKAADWEAFRCALERRILRVDKIRTQTQIDFFAKDITRVIQQALDEIVPKLRRSPKMRPGWTEECSEAIHNAKTAERRYRASGDPQDLEEYKVLENLKKRTLRQALSDDHREKVSKTDTIEDLWKLNKWVRNRGAIRTAFMPEIRDLNGTLQTENEEKAKALQQRLFPEPAPADLSDIPDQPPEFPAPLPFPDITEHEVQQAFRSSRGDKAPGSDNIQFKVLKEAAPVIGPLLTQIYNASLQLHYWPACWKEATVIVIRKPGKKDYCDPKSYRPISLLNTLSKNMEFILAKRISAIAEIHHLLPTTHCGGRKSSSTEHAIHLLLEQIYAGWKENQVSSLLLLDVSGAFDNVNHQRLLWNIRELGFNENLVGWIASFLTGRTGRTRFNEGLMQPFKIEAGIPQGSPLSPILWLLYNYKALQVAGNEALVTGYIDDTCILVTGETTQENCIKLNRIHEKMVDWAVKHGAVFAPQKYELLHFFKKPKKALEDESNATVQLQVGNVTQEVRPTPTARYLGVWLDSGLTGEAHLKQAITKANQQKEALRSIAGPGWGVPIPEMVKLYKATVLPRLLYGCSAWAPVHRGFGYKTCFKKMEAALKRCQKQSLAALSGAFRSTAGAALDVELHVEPILHRMAKIIYSTTNRIQSSPIYEKICQLRAVGCPVRLKGKKGGQTWQSPLQRCEKVIRGIMKHPNGLEPKPGIERNTPFSTYPWWQPPQTVIADNREEAVQLHQKRWEEIQSNPTDWTVVYCDGSEKDRYVGTAAKMMHPKQEHISFYMGDSTISAIYAAELYGIGLALFLAIQHGLPGQKVVIFTDNQSAVQEIRNPKNHSGQQYIKNIIHHLQALREAGSEVWIQWVPGHTGIPGNEIVDELAKAAADPSRKRPPDLVQLRTSVKRGIKAEFKKRWIKAWKEAPYGRKLFDLVGAPHKDTLELYKDTPRALTTTIIRARTQVIGLRGYLGAIGLTQTRECECGGGIETVKHLVLSCPKYNHLRKRIWKWERRFPIDLREELGDTQKAIKIAVFLLRSGTLGQQGRANKSAAEELNRY